MDTLEGLKRMFEIPQPTQEELEQWDNEDQSSRDNTLMVFIRTSDTHFFVVHLPHNNYWEYHQSVGIDLRPFAGGNYPRVQAEACEDKRLYVPMGEDWLKEKTSPRYAEAPINDAVTIYYLKDDEVCREWVKRGGE